MSGLPETRFKLTGFKFRILRLRRKSVGELVVVVLSEEEMLLFVVDEDTSELPTKEQSMWTTFDFDADEDEGDDFDDGDDGDEDEFEIEFSSTGSSHSSTLHLYLAGAKDFFFLKCVSLKALALRPLVFFGSSTTNVAAWLAFDSVSRTTSSVRLTSSEELLGLGLAKTRLAIVMILRTIYMYI